MALINCSECGKQVSDKAQACPHCGHPRELAKGAAAPSAAPREQAAESGWTAGQVGCAALAVIVFIWVVYASFSGSPPTSSSDSSDTKAWVMCKAFVTKRLRSPATADFPWFSDQLRSMGNDEYVVRSYVDAQNAFGATVRTNFTCRVKYEGNESWRLVDLDMRQR